VISFQVGDVVLPVTTGGDIDFLLEKSLSLADSLRAEITDLKSSLHESQSSSEFEISSLNEQIEILQQNVSTLEDRLSAKQTEIGQLELEELKNEFEEKSHVYLNLRKAYSKLESEYQKFKVEMEDLIEQKDARIEHLDKSKLTKDQMAKISKLKQDSKKNAEDNKVMKRQLIDLKNAYESLKEGSAQSSRGSSTAAETVRVNELTHQLESSQSVILCLKDKLRECSKQLQEYEKERVEILEVLQSCSIDIPPVHCITRSSLGEGENDESILEEDVLEGLKILGSKFKIQMATLHSLQEKYSNLQEMNSQHLTELESLQTHHTALERRYQTTKSSLQTASQEKETEILRKQELELKINELTSRLSGNQQAVQLEIQVLEEENIELLKENKVLRNETVELRMKLEKFGGEVFERRGEKRTQISDLVTRDVIGEEEERTKKQKVTAENDENVIPAPSQEKKNGVSAIANERKFGDLIDGNAAASESSSSTNSQGQGQVQKRRTRIKAKPAVEQSSGEEQPAECAQS
jgi:hypothetical protein